MPRPPEYRRRFTTQNAVWRDITVYYPSLAKGPAMYTADRECSPAWESIAYERADARNRLEKTRGQLSGLRAYIAGTLRDTDPRTTAYTHDEAEAVQRATLNRSLDWIDMLTGPTYLDVAHSERGGGETHE